jgi:hypothetical protein
MYTNLTPGDANHCKFVQIGFIFVLKIISGMKINKEWHLKNKMPKNPTLDERIKWHLEHQKNCTCRPIPEKLLKMMAEKKIFA